MSEFVTSPIITFMHLLSQVGRKFAVQLKAVENERLLKSRCSEFFEQ